jgi:peptidoglycan/xylan/chitin deacetylase (PgdA/CDA1 family)
MLRHALAPHVPRAAGGLNIALTLPAAPGVVLSFDDGPHPEGTPAVLEILARAGARAAFFLVGEQVEQRPQLAAEIANSGHLVALHGYTHRWQMRLSATQVREDIRRGGEAVAHTTGTRPTWHRPPYGIYSPSGLAAARDAGLKPLLWSRWGKDWRKFTTPERVAARATRDLRAGDVILLHDADFYSARDSHRRTVAALPAILARLDARGLDTVLPI